jgi:hypothetical protein
MNGCPSSSTFCDGNRGRRILVIFAFFVVRLPGHSNQINDPPFPSQSTVGVLFSLFILPLLGSDGQRTSILIPHPSTAEIEEDVTEQAGVAGADVVGADITGERCDAVGEKIPTAVVSLDRFEP